MQDINVRLAYSLVLSVVIGFSIPVAAFAATTPSLGAASTFSVLANTFNNTIIPFGTALYGDLGYATSSGVVFVGGATHINDATYTQAGTDQHTALSALNSQACTFTFGGAVDLATDISHGALGVYAPGVYCSPGTMSIGGGGTIALDGAGTFIFRPTGMLSTSDFSIATTTNGASACDVFWTPQMPTPFVATALGSDTRFVGTVIEPTGAANSDITIGAGTRWVGRALAYDWTVTTNPIILRYITITAPTCAVPPPLPSTATLHVIKHVVNNDGGTAVASSFTLHVMGATGMGIADVAGSPLAGVESPGTSYTLSAGAYTVSENAFSGYTSSFSGDCDASGNVALASGENKICTITNDDIAVPPPFSPPPAILHVVKHVVNNNGGIATASSFTLHVKGATGMGIADVAGSPAVGVESPGTSYSLIAGTYVVSENAFTGYASSISGDCDGGGNVTLISGDNKTCTITNDDIDVPPPVVPPVVPPVQPPVVDPPLVITPDAPNTGAGGNSFEIFLALVLAAGISFGGFLYLRKSLR